MLGNIGGFVDFGIYEYVLKSDGNSNWNLINDVKFNLDFILNLKLDLKFDLKLDLNLKLDFIFDLMLIFVLEKCIMFFMAVVFNMAVILLLVFDVELNSICEWLNIMKVSLYNNNVWGVMYNICNNVIIDVGVGFEQMLIGMIVGIDSCNDIFEGIIMLGVFMGYFYLYIGFDCGGYGSVGSYFLGGYVSWEYESGFYLDGVVKLNCFKSNVVGKMSSGGVVNGSYYSNGLGGYIEIGM